MKSKAVLEFADVKTIAAAAEAEALKNNWAVTIAIVDDGGHLLHLQRLDGAPPISSHLAPAKANTAAMAIYTEAGVLVDQTVDMPVSRPIRKGCASEFC